MARRTHVGLLVGLSHLALLGVCAGQTITVTGGDDASDFGGAQRVADLPGPDGIITFHEAITAANNTPGPQTIAFAVPRNRWWTVLYSDRCVIQHTIMAYVSGDDTTIDFTTQTAFSGDTNPNGGEVAMYYAGAPAGIPNLWLAGNRITVRGVDRLLGNNFEQGLWVTGSDCRVVGSTTTGMTIRGDYGGGQRNQIGGTGPGDRNVFTGPVNILSRAGGNLVVGNTFRWGLRISGDTFWGPCDDNRVGGALPGEGNIFAGHGYTAEEGLPSGTELEVMHARRTLIEGNLVGTSDDGLSRYAGGTGAGGIGVDIGAVDTVVRNNTIGGIARTGSNHYQGQRFGTAIGVGASATGTVLTGNRIGVGVDGVTPVLNVSGIFVGSNPNGIPSSTRVEDNLIRGNESFGVRVVNSAAGVRISRNAISGNGGLGIDLGTAGVTPNDATDADAGPNGLQNFPVLASALGNGATTAVGGTLRSLANQAFLVEVFASPGCDPSGYGEGAVFLGSTTLTTDAGGLAAFDLRLPGVTAGWVATATATQLTTGNTSEFSACLAIGAPACAADFNLDGFLDFFDYLDFVAAFESGGAGADYNADGFVDFFDYDAFIAAFQTGC